MLCITAKPAHLFTIWVINVVQSNPPVRGVSAVPPIAPKFDAAILSRIADNRTKCTAANTAYWTVLPPSTILGSRIVKVDPRPGSLSTVMSPPII